jgi:hypothetical protein
MYRWHLEQEAGVEARLSVVLYSLTRGENVSSSECVFYTFLEAVYQFLGAGVIFLL